MLRRLAMLVLAGAVVVPSIAGALEATTAPQAPVAVSAAAPLRQALIIAPAPGGSAVAADGEAYGTLLRRLGFTLTVVIAEDRPELEVELRRFAASVKQGAEVAVFVLGITPAHGKQLYLTPHPAPPTLAASLLASEGVLLDDLLRRVGDRGPKEIVALIDVCRPVEATDTCQQAAEALPDGVSAVVASRRRGGGGAPLARMASLRADLLPLLTTPDMSFFSLYGTLKGRLDGTDMTLEATPSLSRSFAFLPADFLARLPTPCNGVEATGDADALRGRRLDDLQAACAEAAATYDFSPYFAGKLAILREQMAFSRASDAGCGSDAMAGFLREHPEGRLHDAGGREIAACESRRRVAEQRERAEQETREAAAREQALREQAAREQAERDAIARREVEYRLAEAGRRRVDRPDTAQICAIYLRDYFIRWSSPNAEAMAFISGAYAPFANYYGKTLSHDAIVQEKSVFASRWPQRQYTLLSGSQYTIVDGGCSIKGTVRWRASRQTGKVSEGLAEFEVILAMNPTRIVAESSRVLSRGP